MLTAQAMAAPSIPRWGMSSRFSATLRTRATAVFSRFQELFPPMSRTTSTGPVAMLTSMASDRISRAVRPATNSGPNTRRSRGENTARVKYTGNVSSISQDVAV